MDYEPAVGEFSLRFETRPISVRPKKLRRTLGSAQPTCAVLPFSEQEFAAIAFSLGRPFSLAE